MRDIGDARIAMESPLEPVESASVPPTPTRRAALGYLAIPLAVEIEAEAVVGSGTTNTAVPTQSE